MLFRLEDVHKSYGATEVLASLSFQVNPGERVGLVGRNGAGKTTIFRLITRREETDRGEVRLLRGIRIGLLEQQPSFASGLSVRDEALSVFTEMRAMEQRINQLEHAMSESTGSALEDAMRSYSDLRHAYEIAGGFTYHARAEAVLAGLGFKNDELSKPADQLSGGQKARLALAKLLLSEPDLLLLDEPTNHLDMSAVEWLEEFLSGYKPAFVIVSHDRFLLDRLATKIVEIEAGHAVVYPGNYTSYIRQREERRLAQTREYEAQQELIARTEEFIRRNIAGQKTKQAKSRRNMLERLQRVDGAREERVGDFRLPNVARAGDNVLSVSDLSIGYQSNLLATGINFLLRRGERIGIIGPNGSGKTTFLKTILGEIEALGGGFTWGANIDVDYFDQELSTLNAGSTVIEEIASVAPRASTAELRTYLAKFLFTGDDILKSVAALSGGEQSRLALAKLIYGRANVLVMDEPTNHLDIPSREALERALAEFGGTIIMVSHDRYFLDKLATEILHFEGGRASYHTGSYSDFYAAYHVSQTRLQQEDKKERVRTDSSLLSSEKKQKVARRSLEQIEAEIHLLEAELQQLSEKLATPSSDWSSEEYSQISNRQDEINSRLDALYVEWEMVSPSAN